MRLHPNDVIALVSIAYDLCTGIPAIILGQIWLGVAILTGGVIIVAFFNWWEDRIYRKKEAEIGWLDYMRARDLMAHGNNYGAVTFILGKAYNLTETEIKRLSPDEMDNLLQKLKVKMNAT